LLGIRGRAEGAREVCKPGGPGLHNSAELVVVLLDQFKIARNKLQRLFAFRQMPRSVLSRAPAFCVPGRPAIARSRAWISRESQGLDLRAPFGDDSLPLLGINRSMLHTGEVIANIPKIRRNSQTPPKIFLAAYRARLLATSIIGLGVSAGPATGGSSRIRWPLFPASFRR